MKIYALGTLDEGNEYFPTSAAAIARGLEYGEPGLHVIEHDIGRLNKAVACRLASGRGFSLKAREIWTLS